MRPAYSTTKLWMRWTFILSWLVVVMLIAGGLAGSREAVDLAGIAMPSMVFLIAAMLGIHRYTGSLDFAATQEALKVQPSTPPYDARDQPIAPGDVQ